MTPVMWAAYYNRIAHVRKLISHNADLDEKDVDGKTAMHWVCAIATIGTLMNA